VEYTTVTNLRWSNKEKTAFSCDVNFSQLGITPFAPSPNDPEAHGREIYARSMAGEFGTIADYVLQPDEYPVEVKQNTVQTQGAQTL
jgi:hypothetical protein